MCFRCCTDLLCLREHTLQRVDHGQQRVACTHQIRTCREENAPMTKQTLDRRTQSHRVNTKHLQKAKLFPFFPLCSILQFSSSCGSNRLVGAGILFRFIIFGILANTWLFLKTHNWSSPKISCTISGKS